jgi:hypothetical protein
MAPAARSRKSPHADATAQLSELAALALDPAAWIERATALMESSRHLEVVRTAVKVLEEAADPQLRPVLYAKYEWCERKPSTRDSSGFIRAAIVRALHPIVQPDDLPLLERALTTYQMQGLYELCAELRAVALVAVNDLDPGFAAFFAARFLTDPLTSFSGEPARTAIQVLAAQQQLAPIFGLASWGNAHGEVVGEALRHLTGLPASLVPLLIAHYRESEDEQVLLGLFDLLLEHPSRASWKDEIGTFLRTTALLDLYGIVAMQIVASRDEALITLLRDLATTERDREKARLLKHALELT